MRYAYASFTAFNFNKQKRQPRTHSGQYEIYLAHMTKHKPLRTGCGDPDLLNALWEDLSFELNAYGAGPQRNSTEWMRTFRSWKHQVRCKARAIKEKRGEHKALTGAEERALALWGNDVIEGLQVSSIGFNPFPEEEESNIEVEYVDCLGSATQSMGDFDDSDDDVLCPKPKVPSSPQPTTSSATRLKSERIHIGSTSNTRAGGIYATRTSLMPNQTKQPSSASSTATATAIYRLADRVGDLAASLAKGNEVLLEMSKSHQVMLQMVLDKLSPNQMQQSTLSADC